MAGEAAAYQALIQAQRALRKALERRRARMADRLAEHGQHSGPVEEQEPMACPACREQFALGSTCPDCDVELVGLSFLDRDWDPDADSDWDDAWSMLRRDRMRRAAETGGLVTTLFGVLTALSPFIYGSMLRVPNLTLILGLFTLAMAMGTAYWVLWESGRDQMSA